MGNIQKIKVSLMASEIAPLAKTGGLADVTGALPKYLNQMGQLEIIALMPFYKEVKEKNWPLRRVIDRYELDWPGKEKIFSVFEYVADGFKVYLIANDYYYNRDYLYSPPQGDYEDNSQRFAFFCLAGLETMKLINFQPHLIHVHDWQAALSLAYIRHLPENRDFYQQSSSLFTIHNLAYQGIFPPQTLQEVGLPAYLFNPEDLEFYGKINFLKAGLLYSKAISTVSPTYSQEIQTPEFGFGLDGVLRKRKDRVFGILNGIDYEDWDPATDPALPVNYSQRNLSGKSACRKELLAAFNFPVNSRRPVVGMVSRLAGQKGFDLLVDSLDDLFKREINLIILGTGEQKIQEQLLVAQKKYSDRFGLKIAFDDRLARLIYAGSDYFLIPSRYEPCGLTQMYSLRYGTIPIVRSTGGLKDSVKEFNLEEQDGNGFLFAEYEPQDLLAALDRALYYYQREPFWSKLLENAMSSDFSWQKRAGEYRDLYLKIINL